MLDRNFCVLFGAPSWLVWIRTFKEITYFSYLYSWLLVLLRQNRATQILPLNGNSCLEFSCLLGVVSARKCKWYQRRQIKCDWSIFIVKESQGYLDWTGCLEPQQIDYHNSPTSGGVTQSWIPASKKFSSSNCWSIMIKFCVCPYRNFSPNFWNRGKNFELKFTSALLNVIKNLPLKNC